ncbi:AmmeMemoRadiSam system radical SAM enzyme [Candidatus Falkowbacteria bacterium RIFCSPLOWO2_12_FULL_45_13]|uniref:AmmeMemoRadiSam system radical SAM enzyme n=2 Tax=Candidatus Falkowiibacteriota TaxID=1752728 RepID=A0A1F5SCV0_9BACT|nr:MAG: AmmeMemoRadiSam system radical SAM enzyme [Candidatus Falkowbacteria bacterium RIFCSPLOWO2_02_FULL_45_21]OGF30258.1 MAG: AmmeMemoRadiSam system radical SAM enzyme [Candidatus Falkowbacteria bacterium RIFCSPLOWO2_12_FULL_45_13]
MTEAKFYKKLDKQIVTCQLCCHYCRIKSGAVGLCGARQNIDGTLYSLVYGRPAAVNVDPIEKKPLFHFQPGSTTFSLGTLGCNFRCSNCQNWKISQVGITPLTPFYKGGNTIPLEKTPETLGVLGTPSVQKVVKGKGTPVGMNNRSPLQLVKPQKIIEQALASGGQSIAYTYNEPTIFAEYALDIMKLAQQHNLKNVWVSNGYMSRFCLEAILPCLDATNIDLKSMDDKFYQKNCGAKLKPVLKNLLKIKQAGAHLEITTLIIPGLSDDPAMLKKLAEFIANELGDNVPWHVSRFSPNISWKLKDTPVTAEEAVFQAHLIGKQAGLKYVYAGNVYNTDKENTYCPNCGQLAIKRLGYDITRFDKDGRCAKCGESLNLIA